MPQMAKNVKESTPKKCINWRVNRDTFVPAEDSRSLSHGVETYSAGWFAQGHAVSRYAIALLFERQRAIVTQGTS